MNPVDNPFSPGAGSPPPELVGRADVLDQCDILLARTLKGRSEKSMLLTGLRGVGKTVLLNTMEFHCEEAGYHTVLVEAHEGKSLAYLLSPHLRSLLLKMDRIAGAKDKVRRGLAVLKSFIGSIKFTVDDVPIGLDIEPEKGTADSGDIEYDFPELLAVIADVAKSKGTAVAILIDEVQYFNESELSALIMAMHKMQQRQLPLVLIGAGLPILPRLAGESKSYAERLFNFPLIGPLNAEDSKTAIKEPIAAEGAEITDEALDKIVDLTHGYPYFLQEWGYQAWNYAPQSPISIKDISEATERTLQRLDENFFRVRFDRLTPSEKVFMRAMAEMGEGPYRIKDIAEVLGIKVGSLSPRRAKLIHKGMIYSPNHGDLDFTVPLFDEFMMRAMANLPD